MLAGLNLKHEVRLTERWIERHIRVRKAALATVVERVRTH